MTGSKSLLAAVVVMAIACSDDATQPDAGGADGPPLHDAAVDLVADAGFVGFDAQLEQKLQQALQDYHKQEGLPGAQLSVRQGSNKAWSGAAGMSDTAAKTPMNTDDLLRAGSLTKVFIATLALLLDEQKLLSIDKKLDDYLPGVVTDADKIELYRLLNHTSGIYHFDQFSLGLKPDEIVQYAENQGAAFAPGKGWGYNNTAYILMGMVIEKVTGKKWYVALREKILDPHGLKHTFAGGVETSSGNQAKGYMLVGGALKDVTAERDVSLYGAAGGLMSNAEDISRFFRLLHEGEVLSSASLTKMRETYNAPIPKSVTPIYAGLPASATVSHGLGVGVITDSGEITYGHAGSVWGYQGYVSYKKKNGLCAAALLNVYVNAPKLAEALTQKAVAVFP